MYIHAKKDLASIFLRTSILLKEYVNLYRSLAKMSQGTMLFSKSVLG